MATVSGGDKLRARLAEISAMASSPATLRVGFLEGGGAYPDGTSVAMIAVVNEYGKFAQPPRPYFRNMIAAKSPEWPAAIAGLLSANGCNPVAALSLAGEAIKGQLQESISTLTSPPLAASTIARKGFDKPLIERGIMLHSVAYEVNT